MLEFFSVPVNHSLTDFIHGLFTQLIIIVFVPCDINTKFPILRVLYNVSIRRHEN